jgi:hypothetical protein
VNREIWAPILPIIQAFVEGKQIQQKGYDNRWHDTDTMYSLLHQKYRIKPNDIITGTWSVDFTQRVSGSVAGPTATGTWTWQGSSEDSPPWPSGPSITILKNTQQFVADGDTP